MTFTVLLLTVSAVPVLAAEEGRAPSQSALEKEPRGPTEQELQMLPGPEDIREGIEVVARDDEAREHWLESPEAARQREESRLAFAGIDAPAARELLSTVFAAELAKLNGDLARFLSDAQILASSDETSATVSDGGEGMVLESSLPVRTEDEEGELRKVDISLRGTPEGYETANGLVEVRVPSAAEEPIEVGDRGVSIELLGTEGGAANQPFGEQNTLAPEVLPDTDMLVSPIASGVEIFNLLRSERSPETIRFRVGMPTDAELRPVGSGAQVTRGEERLATIPEPVAVDAQGTDVPVELQIEGDTLALSVRHREGDYAMPILLDPAIEDSTWWVYGQNLDALHESIWGFSKNVAGIHGSTHCIYHCWGLSNPRGLFVSAQSGSYWAWQYGHWFYAAPNQHSYVSGANFHPFVRYDHGCNAATTTYKQPHDYVGLWTGSSWAQLHKNFANHPAGGPTVTGVGQSVVMGLSTAESNFSIPCWRDVYLQGAYVSLDDWGPPVLESVTGIPSGWVSDETQYTIGAQAFDQGLGVQNIAIHPQGWNEFHNEPQQDQCAGNKRDPCAHSYTASFPNPGARFLEGERTAYLQAYDPTLKPSANHNFTTRVDKTPPSVTLEGQLAEITEEDEGEAQGNEEVEKLRLPVYNLTIKATDGKGDDEAKYKRSGVEDIEIYLDGEELEVPWGPQSCSGPDYSCPMTKTYPVALTKLTTAGVHTLKVEAVDQVGKRKKREIEFEYFPATGMKDEYVMHYFPLPNGEGNEEEEEHPARPELAVNVMNGNLVYREQDVDVEGVAVDLEVERYYNSQLPASEDTEWGDGWTLAQTPDLKPEQGASPAQAELVDTSGALEEEVELPTGVEEETFDPELQATLRKKEGGGYELTDETGESATSVAFDATGQTEARLTEGHARVDYTYEEGELAEIAVEDPGTVSAEPAELNEPREPSAFLGVFGSQGSGPGQLDTPFGAAIDAQGDIWVADSANNRIQRFAPDGELLSQFGQPGSEPGELAGPYGLAVDAQGDIWVADTFNHRIQEFTSEGEYLGHFGAQGSAVGELDTPVRVAVGPEGDIWVADHANDRIQRFSPGGAHLDTIGEPGAGPGQLSSPGGIAFDARGDLWVAELGNHRIQHFSSEGEPLGQIGGGAGSEPGQLDTPGGVAFDALGNLWVADGGNDRVQVLSEQGDPLEQIGSEGSEEERFQLPADIAIDAQGDVWVADTLNHRIQRLRSRGYRIAYAGQTGTYGSDAGQFQTPFGLAHAPDGTIWVADIGNSRVQHFAPDGQLLGQLGGPGSGTGQLDGPFGLAVDSQGDIWVADTGNGRVQQFSDEGEPLSQLGQPGTAPGQLEFATRVAIDDQGDVWVVDSGNDRLQEFSPAGAFLRQVGEAGSGPGQLSSPAGLAFGPGGDLWVLDAANHRIQRFDHEGHYQEHFEIGEGQAGLAVGLAIGPDGNLWVADSGNHRLQVFSPDGELLSRLGEEGAGQGQLQLPAAVSVDDAGAVWVADSGNQRLQHWRVGGSEPGEEIALDTDDDPKVEVQAAGDLVSGLQGEEAGEHSYEHDGQLLTAHDGPEGESAYEYDAEDRLSKVTLPNGTWASIAYFPDDRVKSVTVDVAEDEKAAKTTYFEYSEEPRRTFVEVPGAPNLTYDFAEDGSLLKWWHKQQPPEFLSISGSLWIEKGKELPIGDHTLQVIADSPEGIDSIQFIANGDILVDEMTCEQDPEKPGVECTELENVWVTDTASNTPGRLDIEVIVTDSDGNSESERFWVEVPYTPPPPAGVPVAPKFKEIERFREEYGLEVVFPVANELELVERIFDLIHAWHSPYTYEGQVARASAERWGVPLRPADVAELEYRERYLAHNGPLIAQWGEGSHPGIYAGYYMDHPSGGKIRIGFTTGAEEHLEELPASTVAIDRIALFPVSPSRSLASLNALSQDFDQRASTRIDVLEQLTSGEINVPANQLSVGAINVGYVSNFVEQQYGSSDAFEVYFQPEKLARRGENTWIEPGEARARPVSSNRLYAGDWIRSSWTGGEREGGCTLAFGAWEKSPVPQPGGQFPLMHYALTAGHCYSLGEPMVRGGYKINAKGQRVEDDTGRIGVVDRSSFEDYENGFETDAAVIRLNKGTEVPRWIYWSDGSHSMINGAGDWYPGMTLCQSGTFGDSHCGPTASYPRKGYETVNGKPLPPVWLITLRAYGETGDSGGPVWNPLTGEAIGLVSGGPIIGAPTYVSPLKPLEGKPYASGVGLGAAPGALGALGMNQPGQLHVVDGVK